MKLTDNVIDLLKKEGFDSMSNKLRKTILHFGKFPVQGTENIKLFFKAWKEFKNLKIPKEMKKLCGLQLLYRAINIILAIDLIAVSLPIIFFIIWLIGRNIFRNA